VVVAGAAAAAKETLEKALPQRPSARQADASVRPFLRRKGDIGWRFTSSHASLSISIVRPILCRLLIILKKIPE
jgi:hypothetical protein